MEAEKVKPFNLLLKKNIKIEIRSWIWILCEVIVLIGCVLLDIFDPLEHRKCTVLKNNDFRSLALFEPQKRSLKGKENILNPASASALYYAPKNNLTTKIITATEKALGMPKSMGFENEENMRKSFRYSLPRAGINFREVSFDDAPQTLSFTLLTPSVRGRNHVNAWTLRYARNTGRKNVKRPELLKLQHRLYMEWLNDNNIPNKNIPRLEMRSMQSRNADESCDYYAASNLSWFCYTMMFFIPFLNHIWRYSKELEEGIFFHQWMYGFENGHHWLAHFVVSFIHLIILDILVIIPLGVMWMKYLALFAPHNFATFVPISFLVGILTTHNCMLIICAMTTAIIFRNAKNGVLFGTAIWLGSYGLCIMMLNVMPTFNIGVVMSCILFFNNILPYALNLMSELYMMDLRELLFVVLFPIVNILVLVLVFALCDYWSLQGVRDWRKFSYLGISCRRRKDKSRPSKKASDYEEDNNSIDGNISWHNFESGPYNVAPVLSIKNVFTFFDKYKVNPHIKDITMDIYKGEISVILGADSYGKTALIKVLAGWRQYFGSIYFNGSKELHEYLNDYKRIADVYLGYNPVFDLLTLEETFNYFILIKQQEPDLEKNKVELYKWLNRFKTISIDKKKLIKNLSYSQKRLVALCCILCADVPIILLDEPTVHMKAVEQSLYWQILQQEKPDRTIIITTYSADEAEKIGDRIAIFSDGYILAWGTPLFLKNYFATDYTLIVIRDTNSPVAPITELIQGHFTYIIVTSVTGNKIVYKLPGNRRGEYQKMLIDLEQESNHLGIKSFSVVGGDLKDVLMNLSLQSELTQPMPDLRHTLKLNEPILQKGRQHVCPMLYKKVISQKKNSIPFIVLSVAVLFIIQIHLVTKYIPSLGLSFNSERLNMDSIVTSRTFAITSADVHCPYVDVTESVGNTSGVQSYTFTDHHCNRAKDTRSFRGLNSEKLGTVEIDKSGQHMTLQIPSEMEQLAPLALNLAENLILRRLNPNETNTSVNFAEEPISEDDLWKIEIRDLCLPLTLGIVLPIIIASFIISLVAELESGFVTMQKLAGLRMSVFWLINILWDLFIFSIIIGFCFILMAFTTLDDFSFFYALLMLAFIILYFVPAILINYYVAQFVNSNKCRAFLIVLNVHLITGLFTYTFHKDVLENNEILHYIFLVSPTFALLKGADNIHQSVMMQKVCQRTCGSESGCEEQLCYEQPDCCCKYGNLFKWKTTALLPPIVFMILTSFAFALLFAIIPFCRNHYYACPTSKAKIKKMYSGYYLYEDESVIAEKVKVSTLKSSTIKHYNVVVDQIEGGIPKKGQILKTVSFALDKQTCLCIYGSRNCGKTFLIKQLIGEQKIYYGEVYICQMNIKCKARNAYGNIGYCPQQGGLLNVFTPRQLLTLLYTIRGVPKNKIPEYIRELSISLALQPHINKKILHLSYAAKRLLNVAICLMGHSRVLILDEPTRGLSPQDVRIVMNAIRYARFCNRTIIITSNDSYECDVFADNVIMVDDGSMLAMGSTYHLRQIYTLGFYLEIKLRLDGSNKEEITNNLQRDIENVSRFVIFLQEHSELVKMQTNVLRYYLPVYNITYSYLFGSLEKNRHRLNITDYTVYLGSMVDATENILKARKGKIKFAK